MTSPIDFALHLDGFDTPTLWMWEVVFRDGRRARVKIPVTPELTTVPCVEMALEQAARESALILYNDQAASESKL